MTSVKQQPMYYVRGNDLITPQDHRRSMREAWTQAVNALTVGQADTSKAYGMSATGYACTNYRADVLSAIPVKVALQNGEPVDWHPMAYFLQHSRVLLWHISAALDIWGDSYLLKIRNMNGFPTALQWLFPDEVDVERDSHTNAITGYRYNNETYGPENIVHHTTFNTDPSGEGKSPFTVVMSRVLTEQNAMQYAASFFFNGARLDGILTPKNGSVGDEDVEQAKEDWKQFKSAPNSFKTFISSGDWVWTPIQSVPGDLALTELKEDIRRDICVVFNVDPVLIGIGAAGDPLSANSTRESIERAFVKNVAIPRMLYILGELNSQWAWKDFGKKNYFNLTPNLSGVSILSDITSDRTTAAGAILGYANYDEARGHIGLPARKDWIRADPTPLITQFSASGLTLNELRRMQGLDELPGGDVVMVAGKLVPVARLMEYAEISIAQAEMQAQPPTSPFGLSDVERAIRLALDDNRGEASIVETLVEEIRGFAASVREALVTIATPPTLQLPAPADADDELSSRSVSRTVRKEPTTYTKVSFVAPFADAQMLVYACRALAEKFIAANIRGETWLDPSRWCLSLIDCTGQYSAADLSAMIRLLSDHAMSHKMDLVGAGFIHYEDGIGLLVRGQDAEALRSSLQVVFEDAGLSIDPPGELMIPLCIVPAERLAPEQLTSDLQYPLVIEQLRLHADGQQVFSLPLRSFAPAHLKELSRWEQKVNKRGARIDFKREALGEDVYRAIAMGLRMGIAPDTVFKAAFKYLRGDLEIINLDEAQTSKEYEKYWGKFDKLAPQIGSTWLKSYMSQVYDDVVTAIGDTPTALDLTTRLNESFASRTPALVETWVGTVEKPGSMLKLALAGMAAGNDSVLDNVDASYRALLRSIAIATDWDLLNQEALAFAKSYSYNLISGLNTATVQQIQEVMAVWIESGESISVLVEKLNEILKDEKRAALIAQTESTRVFAAGCKRRWQDLGVQKGVWHTVRDQHVCPICAPLDGVEGVLSAGWQHPGGTLLDENDTPLDTGKHEGKLFEFPSHPGCRCFARPVVDSEVI